MINEERKTECTDIEPELKKIQCNVELNETKSMACRSAIKSQCTQMGGYGDPADRGLDLTMDLHVFECVCVCVYAWVRAWVCVCVRACVGSARMGVFVHVCDCMCLPCSSCWFSSI